AYRRKRRRCANQLNWEPVQCSGASRPARFRCPQTPSAKMGASALGLPLILGARPLFARSARCASNARAAPPRAPDPVGQLDRSRGRPPPSLPGARPLAPGSLHLPAALEGAADRDHVDVLEVAADWDEIGRAHV